MKFQIDSKSIQDEVIQIQSRSMSDPPLYDIDFKNKMARVRTSLKELDFGPLNFSSIFMITCPDFGPLFNSSNFRFWSKFKVRRFQIKSEILSIEKWSKIGYGHVIINIEEKNGTDQN